MLFMKDSTRKSDRARCTPSFTLLLVATFVIFGGTAAILHGSGAFPFFRGDTYALSSPSDAADPPACRPASVTVSVATAIINAVAQIAVVPALQDESNVAIIPEQEDGHIWVDRMLLSHFLVDSLGVETATPNAESITVSADGFGLTVNETRFRYTYLGIRCYGHFTATLNETNINAVMELRLLPQNRWNAVFTELTFAWGTLAIEHALDSKACGIAQSIVEIFTGQLDKFIADKVQKKLDEDGKHKATEVLNSLFEEAPVLALSPPIMTADRLSVVLDATPKAVGCAPQPPVSSIPALLPRDIATHTSVTDVNNAYFNAATRGLLTRRFPLPESVNTSLFLDVIPEVYDMCPDCAMEVQVRTTTPPVSVFLPVDTVTLAFRDLVVGLYVIPSNDTAGAAFRALMAQQVQQYRDKFERTYRQLGYHSFSDAADAASLPVVALSCGGTLGVRDLRFVDGRALHYELLPVQDFNVSVAASVIGTINTAEIEQKGMAVWNTMVVRMVNKRPPLKLPPFLRKAVLNMTLQDADFGVSIGFMKDFARTFDNFIH